MASHGPDCQQCPVTSRMASLPTLGVGTVALHNDDSGSWYPALVVCISVIHVDTTCDEGAFITLILHQMSMEEDRFLLQSHSVPCRQGVKPMPLQTREARGVFSTIKNSALLLP